MEATLACFQMLYLGMPFRRDVLKRALANSFERSGSIFQLCGAIAELMGLNSSWLMYLQPPSVACKPSYAQVVDSFALKLVKRTGSSCTRNWHPTHQTSSFIEAWRRSGAAANHQRHSQAAVWPGLVLPSLYRYQSIVGSFDCFLFCATVWSGQP